MNSKKPDEELHYSAKYRQAFFFANLFMLAMLAAAIISALRR